MSLTHENNSTSNVNFNYTLRLATLEDAHEIWTVMDTCFQALKHKEHFICDDLNYVKDILSGHGFGVVACDMNGKIVGNLLIKYPGLSEENLGYDVFMNSYKNNSLPSGSNDFLATSTRPKDYPRHAIPLTHANLNRVLHMDSASVLPSHRGHGLERSMIAYAETLVDISKYYYSFATVAPENTASLKSLEKNGYKIVTTKEKYGGFNRYILMKLLES